MPEKRGNYRDTTVLLFTRQKAGTLKIARCHHGAIFAGEKFLIIGGAKKNWGTIKNEVCTLNGSKMKCVEQSASLTGVNTKHPELFLVPYDFGEDNFTNNFGEVKC